MVAVSGTQGSMGNIALLFLSSGMTHQPQLPRRRSASRTATSSPQKNAGSSLNRKLPSVRPRSSSSSCRTLEWLPPFLTTQWATVPPTTPLWVTPRAIPCNHMWILVTPMRGRCYSLLQAWTPCAHLQPMSTRRLWWDIQLSPP